MGSAMVAGGATVDVAEVTVAVEVLARVPNSGAVLPPSSGRTRAVRSDRPFHSWPPAKESLGVARVLGSMMPLSVVFARQKSRGTNNVPRLTALASRYIRSGRARAKGETARCQILRSFLALRQACRGDLRLVCGSSQTNE